MNVPPLHASPLTPLVVPPVGPLLPSAAEVSAAERHKVAGQFEAVLIRQLLGPTLTKMLGSDGGAASDVYGDLLTDAVAQQLSAGQGLGLGRVIEQQLTPRAATSAARAAAS